MCTNTKIYIKDMKFTVILKSKYVSSEGYIHLTEYFSNNVYSVWFADIYVFTLEDAGR